ncbi:Protein RIC1 like protein [Melipona quadrifasciata]|uniref:Protein RIC1 like protein n=1 Tax=Melipona quadrifasciata TaxID=166423 RepID=A0A0N0BID9_9HYME|nr:Protein RIC1 like protein [Melipona quadrifasciata]
MTPMIEFTAFRSFTGFARLSRSEDGKYCVQQIANSKYTAIDNEGMSIAVAGRTGLAHYSLPSRKWKLFGNETQERDFIVTGGLLWHRGFLIASSYSLLDDKDEVRMYPRDTRLDNNYVRTVRMPSQVGQVLLWSELQCREGRLHPRKEIHPPFVKWTHDQIGLYSLPKRFV